MIKQMLVGFCWNLMLLWTQSVLIFRALKQFKKSKGSPGLFQDLEDGYIKL